MKKTLLSIVYLLLFSLLTFAQNKIGKITGSIKDGNGTPIDAATVTLLRAKDSALSKVAVSNKQGEYEFEKIAEGRYLISVTAVGFGKKLGSVFEITASNSTVQGIDLALERKGKALGEVTVTGKRPLIENKIDRTVINVEAAPSNAGATAFEVLEKSPGITISNEGAISLKGKSGVIVMIDNKPTYLSSADLANYLKNLPASALDQIEIMPNPPARYDASGNSGIVNIKTKKSRSDGFNGSITIGGSVSLYERNDKLETPMRQTTSINMNYRKGKLNVFGNYNFNYREGMGDLYINRKFYEKNGDLNSISQSHTEFTGLNNNHTLKFGVDYYLNKKNVIGVVVNGFGFFGKPTPYSLQKISKPDGTVESILESNTTNDLTFFNYSANVNYKHTFDSIGREITFDLDYVAYDNTSNTLLVTDIYNGSGGKLGSMRLLGNIPSKIDIYSLKSDYVHPLNKTMRLEAGFKLSYVTNDNEVDYRRPNNGVWVPDSRSNHFIYDENINAAYVSVNKKWKKWSAQVGLRAENTNAKGMQVAIDSGFNRHYTNVFPTTFVNYDMDKNNMFTLSFGRRIERPNYQDLNPFFWFLDSLTYRQGNPYLLPQFAYNSEFRHSWKNILTTTLNYSITEDVISQILKQNTEERITYLTVDNIARFRNMGLAINAALKPMKWWNSNIFFNVFNNRYTGTYYNSYTAKNDPIDLGYTSFMVNITNNFSFKKGWSAELSGWYRGKSVEQLSISEPMYFMTVGAQKIILKNMGTLRLNVRDPFHWQRYAGSTRYSDIDLQVRNKWDNRNITFTFSYRFGKSTVAQARRRNTGTSEEQNRAGSGQQ